MGRREGRRGEGGRHIGAGTRAFSAIGDWPETE